MGGGGKPKTKRESNAERNARILAGKKSGSDAKALQLQEEYLRRARKRSALFGGPETGATAPATLGAGGSKLGVMV